MKRNYFTAILLSAFAATAMISCDKSDNIATGTPSITSSGTISGQIDSLQSSAADSVIVTGFHDEDNGPYLNLVFAKCKLDGNKFSMQLMTPPTHFLNHLQFEENYTETYGYYTTSYSSNVIVSDTTIYGFGALEFNAYKNGLPCGDIIKANNIKPGEAGYKYSVFMYSDKYCTIKGTEIYKREYNNGSKKYTPEYYETHNDAALKPGWNEFVISDDKVIDTDSTHYNIQTISNTIPTDLKWKLIPRTNYYNSPQKRIGANQKVHHMGFIGRLLK